MAAYLLVDGYNIIFAWKRLAKLAEISLELARDKLIDILVNFAAYQADESLILVFDAHKVTGGAGEVEQINGITVVYTKERETADAYIERSARVLTGTSRVRVATSDALEQLIILSSGAYRVSAREFEEEIFAAEKEIAGIIEKAIPIKKNALFTNLDDKTLARLNELMNYPDASGRGIGL